MRRGHEGGYTLAELLVVVSLLSITSVSFYSVLFAGSRSGDTNEAVVRISEEARAGFNRMTRDIREADVLACSATNACTSTRFRVQIDFDGGVDSNGDGNPYDSPNAQGDFEDLTVTYDATDDTVRLNGEVLMRGVEPVPGAAVFDYSSNFLEYDWNADGVTSWQELDAARDHGVAIGNGNRASTTGPDGDEAAFISSVHFSLRVRDGDQVTRFYGEAQLRNRR